MPVVPDPGTLAEIPLFQGLPVEQLARLNTLLHRKTFPPATNIIAAEQPGEAAYLILSGTVKIHVEQPNGSDVILAILGAGEIVGELSLVDSFGRSATVVTIEETSCFWIDRAAFQECLQSMPLMTYNLVRILSGRLRIANAQIQSIATLDVFGRVARQLLAFAQEYGEPTPGGATRIPLRLTQTDLAGLVGATRVRVNQVLVFYKQQGYIAVDQGAHISILDAAALARRCQ